MRKIEVIRLANVLAKAEPVTDKAGENYHKNWEELVERVADVVFTFSKMSACLFVKMCKFENYRERNKV